MDAIKPSVTLSKSVPVSMSPMTEIMRSSVNPSKSYSVKMISTVKSMKDSVKPSNSSKLVMSSTVKNPTECPAQKCGAHAFVPDIFLLVLSLGILAIAGRK